MRLKIVIVCLLIFSAVSLIAQKTPDEMTTAMARGINLGNVFSAPAEGNWSPVVYEQYFIDVAAEGFTNMRLPIDFFGTRTSGDTSGYSSAAGTSGDYNGNPSDYVVDATYLNRIEEVIGWSLNQGLITVLDFHGSTLKTEFIQTFDSKETEYTDPTSAKRAADNEKFRTIWSAIAERFENYSDNLIFEVINEPYFDMSASDMNTLNSDIISIIRASGGNNGTRKIVITGGGENSINAPLQIDPAILSGDNYLIASFHYYWPRAFTASSKETLNDFDWGTPQDKQDATDDFNVVKTWATTNSTAVVLGEFGADNEGGFDYETGIYGDYGGPEDESRVDYHYYLAGLALNMGFAFTAWDAGNESNKAVNLRLDNPATVNYNFNGSVNTSKWVTNVKDALLTGTLSTYEVDYKEDISITMYPNPVMDMLTISAPKNTTIEKVAIYNVLGQKILEQTNAAKTIYTGGLAKGIYFAKIYQENDVISSKRFIKK